METDLKSLEVEYRAANRQAEELSAQRSTIKAQQNDKKKYAKTLNNKKADLARLQSEDYEEKKASLERKFNALQNKRFKTLQKLDKTMELYTEKLLERNQNPYSVVTLSAQLDVVSLSKLSLVSSLSLYIYIFFLYILIEYL